MKVIISKVDDGAIRLSDLPPGATFRLSSRNTAKLGGGPTSFGKYRSLFLLARKRDTNSEHGSRNRTAIVDLDRNEVHTLIPAEFMYDCLVVPVDAVVQVTPS